MVKSNWVTYSAEADWLDVPANTIPGIEMLILWHIITCTKTAHVNNFFFLLRSAALIWRFRALENDTHWGNNINEPPYESFLTVIMFKSQMVSTVELGHGYIIHESLVQFCPVVFFKHFITY